MNKDVNVATNKRPRPFKHVHWGEPSKIEYEEPRSTRSMTMKKWYGASEIQSFKDERKIATKLVNEFGEQAVESSGRATRRGVEHLQSKRLFNEKQQRQQLAVQVVLDAENSYRSLPPDKREQVIAIQYQSLSSHCQKVAHERARAYWEETERETATSTTTPELSSSAVPPSSPLVSSSPSQLPPATPTSSSSARKGNGVERRRRGLRALLKSLPVM